MEKPSTSKSANNEEGQVGFSKAYLEEKNVNCIESFPRIKFFLRVSKSIGENCNKELNSPIGHSREIKN